MPSAGRVRPRVHLGDEKDAHPATLPPHRTASYVPHSSRSAPHSSPTVARAASAVRSAGSRFAAVGASLRISATASSTAAESRPARSACRRSSCARSIAGSRRWSSTRSAASVVKRLTPTMTRSPSSTSRCQRNADSSICSWTQPASIAATAPPSCVDLLDQLARAGLELVGERLDVPRAAERVRRRGRARPRA